MFLRGDWIVPTFNHELRTDKPILIYWIMLCSYTVFGVNEFAARFGSSALAVSTAVLVYHLGRKLFNREVGLYGAVMLCTCLMYCGSGPGGNAGFDARVQRDGNHAGLCRVGCAHRFFRSGFGGHSPPCSGDLAAGGADWFVHGVGGVGEGTGGNCAADRHSGSVRINSTTSLRRDPRVALDMDDVDSRRLPCGSRLNVLWRF